MPLPDTSPAFKTFALKAQGLDPDKYDLSDEGQVTPKAIQQPAVGPSLSPAPDAEPLAKPPEPSTSVGGTLLHSAERAAVPTGLGLLGGALGVAAAPETGGLSLLIPLLGGLGGGYAGEKLQEPFLSDEFKQQSALEAQQHPIASTIGGLAPSALAFNPLEGIANAPMNIKNAAKMALGRVGASGLSDIEQSALRNAAVNAGIQGGTDVAQQLISGQPFNFGQAALQTAAGGIMNQPWGLGKMLFPNHAPTGEVQGAGQVQPKPPEVNPYADWMQQAQQFGAIPTGATVDAEGNVTPQGVYSKPVGKGKAKENIEQPANVEGTPVSPFNPASLQSELIQRANQMPPIPEAGPDKFADFLKAKEEVTSGRAALEEQTQQMREEAAKLQDLLQNNQVQQKPSESAFVPNAAGEETSLPKRDYTGVTEQANQEVQDESPADLEARRLEAQQSGKQRPKYQEQSAVQTPTDDNDPLLLRNASPAYRDAVQQLAAKRGISLKEAMGLTRPETGKEVLGAYNPNDRTALVNPNRAELDTPIHEGTHGYLDDLRNSANPKDRSLYQRALGIFGGDEAHAEEALTGKLGVAGVPRVEEQIHGFALRNFNSWFHDYVARWKNTLGVANDNDVIRHLSARYFHDAPYGSRAELNPSLRYTGFQPGMAGREGFKMYTATDDIKDKNGQVVVPKDSTVSDKSLQAKGIDYQHESLLRPTPTGYNDLTPEERNTYARLHGEAMVARKEHEVGGKEGTADNLIDKELALKKFSEEKGMKYQEEPEDSLKSNYAFAKHINLVKGMTEALKQRKPIISIRNEGDFKRNANVENETQLRDKFKEPNFSVEQHSGSLYVYDNTTPIKYQESSNMKLGLPKDLSQKNTEAEQEYKQLPLTRSANDTILAKEGVRAKPFIKAINDNANQRSEDIARYKTSYNQSVEGLSDAEKNHVEEVLMRENRDKAFHNDELNPKEQEAYGGLRNTIRQMQEDRIEANQPVKAVDAAGHPFYRQAKIDPYYWPNQISPKAIEALERGNTPMAEQLRSDWEEFQKAHKVPDAEAKSSLDSILGSYNKATPNLAHFRGVDIEQGHGLPESFMRPGLDRNMDRYINRFATARAYHDNIESNPQVASLIGEKTTPWGKPIENAEKPLSSSVAKDVIHRLKGQDYNPEESNFKGAARIASASMLGPQTNVHVLGSTVANTLGQAVMPKEVAGMVTHMISDFRQAAQHAIDLGNIRQTRPMFKGLFDAHATTAERMNIIADGISRLQGRNLTDYISKATSQAANEWLVKNRIELARAGDKASVRFMQGLDSSWSPEKAYSDKEKIQLAGDLSNRLHGVHDSRTQPNWMLKDNIIQPFTSLMGWSVAQTNNFMKHVVTPASQGDYRPLIMNTLGAVLGGYVIKQGREMLANKKSPIPSFQDIAAAPGGISGHIPLDIYNLLAMTSFAGYGGIMSMGARSLFDLHYKNPVQGSVFPLDEALSNTFGTVRDAASALMNSHDLHETTQIALHAGADFLKGNAQGLRIAMNWAAPEGLLGAEKQRQFNLSQEEGDLRRWKTVTGQPTQPIDTEQANPYLNMNRKVWQRNMNIQEAAQDLPNQIRQAMDESGGNIDVLKSKLQALKDGQYPSFPSIEHTPRLFFNFLKFLQDTKGPEAAAERMTEYLRNNQVNKIKGSMVPSF